MNNFSYFFNGVDIRLWLTVIATIMAIAYFANEYRASKQQRRK